MHPIDGQDQRSEGVYGEAEVVHLDPAEHVAEPPERHHEDAAHHQERQDQPEQVEAVASAERVEVDALEYVREGDQHDRRVDRRHDHAKGGVGQRHPLVVDLSAARNADDGTLVPAWPVAARQGLRPRGHPSVLVRRLGRSVGRNSRHLE